MAGKVLVSTQEHIDRLIAARLQADIMATETIVVARTDAEAATLLDNNVDPRDHPYILGATNPSVKGLNDVLREAEARGASQSELVDLNANWDKKAGLATYTGAVEAALKEKGASKQTIADWRHKSITLSNTEARAHAKSLGVEPFFDWEAPRTREGYYRYQGGLDACVARGIAYAPYADLSWMETKKPILHEAEHYAREVRKVHPWALFAYNLSPSFNWYASLALTLTTLLRKPLLTSLGYMIFKHRRDEAGMSDEEIRMLNINLGKAGYVWQFITLAGFHSDALITTRFSRAYAKDYMLAYVNMIQRAEAAEDVSTLTHQKWSGAEMIDTQLQTITGGLSSTTALGQGNTEAQFGQKQAAAVGGSGASSTARKGGKHGKKPTEEQFSSVFE